MGKHTKMLNSNHNGIVDGVQMTLKLFHDSLVSRDLSAINRIAEGNLAKACQTSFEMLDQENCKLVERDVAEVSTKVELVDFCQILGANVDRATNRQIGLFPFEIYPET